PDHGVTHYFSDGSRRFHSYAELQSQAEALAGGLRRAGVRPDTPVILQLAASDEFAVAFWACLIGGYIAVPVLRPPTYAQDGNVRRKVLLACESLAPADAVVLLAAEDRGAFAAVAAEAGFSPRILTWDEVATAEPIPAIDSQPERVALMLFTSGSTGAGKGVPLTEGNLLAMSAGTIAMNGFDENDVALNWMAADHVGAVVFLGLVPVDAGCSQVQVATEWILQQPTRWLDLISNHRAS